MMSTAAAMADKGVLSGGSEGAPTRAERVAAADKVLQSAKAGVRAKVAEAGGIDSAQHAAHGLAWLATAVEGLRQMHVWGTRLSGEGRFGEFEQLILVVAFAEYLAQIAGGIPMSQVEIVRPEALGVSKADTRRFEDEVADTIAAGSTQAVKSRLAELIAAQPAATTLEIRASTRRMQPSTSRCAGSHRPRSCRTRTNGICRTPTSRCRSSTRSPSSASSV
jgi:(2S)-methylsuccinyl-CoA dehydrogenase